MKRTAALQLGWLATQAGAWARLRRAVRDPEAAVRRRFEALRPALGPTARGRAIGLDRATSPDDLRRLPIGDWEAHAPWIERVAAGEPGVLTTERVEALEPTGGSTGGEKWIPTTRRLRAEFAEAVGAWMVDLHRSEPGLLGTRSYWSISRAVRAARTSPGGLPIGLPDDAAYFGRVEQWAIRRLMAVDGAVAGAPTVEDWRRATLTALVEAEDLGLISVWSPTFLTALTDALAAGVELPLSAGAAQRLAAARRGGGLDGSVLWPRLRVISAWGDGFAAGHVAAMRAPFPGVAFQPKGVLATEGVVSVPWGAGEGSLLAGTAHLLELRDVQTGAVHWPWEVRVGQVVQPLLTTGGGLCRYPLPDALAVVGRTGRLPRIRLVERLDRGSDRVGEKLTAGFVDRVIPPLFAERPRFVALVPAEAPLRYVLVTDGEAPEPAAVDAALRQAYHYAHARDLGQLGPVEVRGVPDARARWEAALEAAGLRLGDQKPQILETRPALVAALSPGAPRP